MILKIDDKRISYMTIDNLKTYNYLIKFKEKIDEKNKNSWERMKK